MKTINIIGAGNVAHYFGIKLNEAGYDIKCIYNRTISKANDLAKTCGSIATNDLIALPLSDLTIIAVTDDHIAQLSKEIFDIHQNSLSQVHTSGAITLDVFPDDLKNAGCIWPLHSITKGQEEELNNLPLCIDGTHEAFREELNDMCCDISNNVIYLPSEKKKYAHVAAVIANNFTNHLLTLSEEYCQNHNVDFDILKPLIIQSIKKIQSQSPRDIQTGPARRMDMHTINNHLDLIEDAELKKIYRSITKSIISTYHENS